MRYEELTDTINLETAKTMLEVLQQKSAWRVARAAGSWLSFHFGKQMTNQDGFLTGEWGLYIYEPWIIQTEQEAIVSSNDNQPLIDMTLLSLQGKPVLDIIVNEPSFDMTLSFITGTQLRIFPAYAEDIKPKNSYWMFAHDAHYIIAFYPKQSITYSDLRDNDEPR
jgi:hypothetical protein